MTNAVSAPTAPPASRWLRPGLLAAALLPLAYVIVRTALVMKNAAYWDEFETVLDFLLKLRATPSLSDALATLFSVGNEHRTVTSRMMIALGYALTGKVNFIVLGIVGNLCVAGVGVILITTAGTVARRLQMAVVFCLLIFQLQHFESFFWSGSSIDHFQVVTLATATFAALASGSRRGVLLAGLTGLLASFTLAHGLLVWPVGALTLAWQRRWRQLALWALLAGAAVGGFILGFSFNVGHSIGDHSAAGLGRIAHYWLKLLGAPLALGSDRAAPFLGAALLVLVLTQLRRRILDRERIAFPLLIWCVGALALVAVGRVDVVGGHVHSRYYVLSCLAWALVTFMQLNAWADPARPYRALLRVLPALVTFNIAANVAAENDARSWAICRDNALEYFLHYGRDGMGTFQLHPIPAYTLLVTRKAEQAGIFRMPETCPPRRIASPRPVGDIAYFVDRIPVDDSLVAIEGWAAIPGQEAKAGQIHVILQSEKSRLVFATVPKERPDVGAAHPGQKWASSGFRFQQRRWLLPAENFQIGLLIVSGRGAEYVMTAHRLDLTGQGVGILAGSP